MNPFDLLKNSMAIKEQTDNLKKEMANITAEGSSGGKMVTLKINGQFELLEIHLDPLCVDNRDVKMLEDLIIAAHKDASTKIHEQIKEKTSSLLGNLNIPDLGL